MQNRAVKMAVAPCLNIKYEYNDMCRFPPAAWCSNNI